MQTRTRAAKVEAAPPLVPARLDSEDVFDEATVLERLKPGLSCDTCRRAKIKCVGGYPCPRCFRLGVKCLPQRLYLRRRPSRQAQQHQRGRGEEEEQQHEGEESGGEGGEGEGEGEASEDAEEEDAEESKRAAMNEQLRRDLVGLCFSRSDPRPVADLLQRCFLRKARDPSASPASVISILRQWHVRNIACGADGTFGVLNTCMRELGVTALDLEPPEWVVQTPSVEQRRAEVRRRLSQSLDDLPHFGQRFKEAFAQADDGETPLYMGVRSVDGVGFNMTNAAFRQRFYNMQEVVAACIQNRVLMLLLVVLLAAPEDREDFLMNYLDVVMSAAPRRVTFFFKVFDRGGGISLYLLKARPALVDGDNIPSGILMHIEPCPPSRHLTVVPGVHTKIKSFRKISRSFPSPPDAGGGGGGGGPSPASSALSNKRKRDWGADEGGSPMTLPALAMLPIPMRDEAQEPAEAAAAAALPIFGDGASQPAASSSGGQQSPVSLESDPAPFLDAALLRLLAETLGESDG